MKPPLWLLGWTDVGLNAQAEQEAAQGRGKIAAALGSHPSGVPIKSELTGHAILLEELL